MIKRAKYFFLFGFLLLILSLLVFWPSFNLHLTGDDYLGLWRYHYYLDGHTTGSWNNFIFFLTDYGPQDTFTAIIHHFFGFQPAYYFFFSYILRLLAAISFFPLIVLLTKNKTAAYFAMIFFAITTTGLETTDWSFNMPSYLAIALMNFFLFVYLKARDKNSYRLFFLSAFIFYLTIIAQPIRMTFLPGALILFEFYLLFRNRNLSALKATIVHVSVFAAVMVIVYVTGFVGNSIGAGETLTDRLNGGWKKVFANNFSALIPYLLEGKYYLFTYPFGIFGSTIFPSTLIPADYQILTPIKAFFKLLLPMFLLFVLFIRFGPSRKPLIAAVIWSAFVFLTFSGLFQHALNISQFVSMLIGGYTVIVLLFLFIRKYQNHRVVMGIIMGIFITFLSFAAPWLRNPEYLYESTGRYLIVPAAGLTILLGVLLGSARSFRAKVLSFGLISILIVLHMYTSFSYLYHLSTVRSTHTTENIRKSIPNVKNFNDPAKPLMFYFEPLGSEILHHSLLFGFPVIMGYQYDFFNVWHIAYTDNWEEVVLAYKDGSSLKRFSIPVKKVAITDIYSFRLEGYRLVNTTRETRQKLQDLQ